MRRSGRSGRRASRRTPAGAALLLTLTAAGPPTLLAEPESSLWQALADGSPTLELRYRYEEVGDDAVGNLRARASTLRTALGYRSRAYRRLLLQLEAENVAVIGNDLYDNRGAGGLGNGVRDRPAVADPAGTEINQALVRYLGNRWQVAAGRQEVLLGDERFVGDVGWRQNHQSFDALRVDNSSLGGLRFTYIFVDRVNRVFGDSRELTGHLLNTSFDLQNFGKFTLYGYLLDYRDAATAEQSTSTWGLELDGRRRLTFRTEALYELEHAEQSDYADNPRAVDAGYSSLMIGVGLQWANLRLAWEQLDGSPADGRFTTPLATLHEWNGWADRFLETPTDGLEDLYLQVDGEVGPLAWLVRYHDFGAQSSSVSYGQELDLRLLYTGRRGLTFGLKGALYDADRFAADTDSWMLWASYKP